MEKQITTQEIAEQTEEQSVQTEPQTTIDWKAQSRKWERRAKENIAAAEELQKLKEEQMSEQEKFEAAYKRVKTLETELQQTKEQEQITRDALEVAEVFGIPRGLITARNREDMEKQAQAIKDFAKSAPSAQVFPTEGKKPTTKQKQSLEQDFNDWFDSAF